ncbi:hypothetical protein BDN70DRAFT_922483 [Pholiota conissans]|uniref:Uncharacterized protein n=1 Tax=Pholiota conissans TaxID=109636 RepID=A0A9P6CYM0_9AGAR|nr:hypothetical protein BDN70DRAFT_922483 [Pholiota conissans]
MASGCFGALKSLDLCLVISPEQTIPPFPLEAYSRFHALAIAPRLRSVIVRLHDNLHPLALRLPWGQLTFLDLVTTAMFPESLLTIFRICAPRLQSGYFYIKFDKPIVPGLPLSNGSITMWALRSLRLKLLYPDADGRLFSILQFPSLQNIWIELHNSFQEWNLILYTNLLRASSNSLRLLMLSDFIPNVEGQIQGNDNHLILRRPHDTPYHATAIEGLFQVASNIEALYLPVGLHVDGTTLDKIACCILLPRLRMLELGAINAWHVISSVRRRHQNVLTSTNGHSRITRIQMLVPENMYHGIEKTALDAEVRALNFLDITFQIKPTCILPLPPVVHG